MNLKLINATILTLDDSGTIIKNGCVEMTDGYINYAGPHGPHCPHADSGNPDAGSGSACAHGGNVESVKDKQKTIDCGGDIVMPAFVNAHSHLAMTAFRSIAEGVSLEEWLYKHIFPREKIMDGKFAKESAEAGVKEMLANGIVGVVDMYTFPYEIADVLEDAGMYGRVVFGGNDFGKDCKETLKIVREQFLDMRQKYTSKVLPMLGAHAEYTCSESYLDGIAEMSNEFKVPVAVHVSETLKEVGECAVRHNNLSPPQYLHKLGLFEHGGILAHCVYCDKDDLALIKQQDMTIALNTGSNLKLGSGIAQLGSIMQSGVKFALGTDSAASNNRLDIMREMYLTAVLTKGVMCNPALAPPLDMLRAATLNGYRALGINDSGIVKAGMRANLIVLSLKDECMKQKNDIMSDVVYSASSNQVLLTMCEGKILYKKSL